MSNIPELLLHRVLVNGFKMVRQNMTILDTLFPNLDKRELQLLKDFFLNNSVEFLVNYPKAEVLKVPAIVLTLQSENESQSFLNDVIGIGGTFDIPGQSFLMDTLGGNGASVSTTSNLPKKIVGDIPVSDVEYDEDNDITTIYWSDNYNKIIIDSFKDLPSDSYSVYIIKGSGSGQKATISSIRNNSLDIIGYFDPQLDVSSFLDIRKTNVEGIDGQPSRIFEEDNLQYIGRGANYEVQYQLGIYAGSQYEVVFLYAILKAILLSQRNYLEAQNIQALTITGSDSSPKGEYLPNIVFGRTMNVRFTYTFSFIEKLPDLSSISVNLTAFDQFTDEPANAITFSITI